MKTAAIILCAVLAASLGYAQTDPLENGSFEDPVGPEGASDGWGARGEEIGEAESVDAGSGGAPESAHDGSRVLRINVPASTLNGIVQRFMWKGDNRITFRGYYQIAGGDLSPGTATSVKMEFFDATGSELSSTVSDLYSRDTSGQWEEVVIDALPPSDTTEVRVRILAGRNNSDEEIKNRIFWDDIKIEGDTTFSR